MYRGDIVLMNGLLYVILFMNHRMESVLSALGIEVSK